MAHPVRAALHHAALVVEHSGGRLITRCVAFTEDQISGLQLIQRSGLEYRAESFGSLGSAMCQLDHEPTTVPADCFGSGPYWQYFHRSASGWGQSAMGAGSSALRDGAMDGWHYAAGASQPPPAIAFNSVCAPAQAVTTVPAASRASAHVPAQALSTPPKAAPHATLSSPTPSPNSSSTPEALRPSGSATAPPTVPAAGASPPRPSSGSPPILILIGAAVLLLSGLFAWNFQRRAS
ncbi:MAG: hypothetical protein ABI401_07775 [Candidatus Dormibacter sp.]